MIKEQVNSAIKVAMKSGDKTRLVTLRMMLSAIKDFEINNRKDPSDAEVIAILRKSVKSRRDAIEQFIAGNRPDLVDKENAEILIVESFLPPAIGDEEICSAVDAAIASTGATSIKEMGAVMKVALAALAGRAEGASVQKIVRERLSAAAPRA